MKLILCCANNNFGTETSMEGGRALLSKVSFGVLQAPFAAYDEQKDSMSTESISAISAILGYLEVQAYFWAHD